MNWIKIKEASISLFLDILIIAGLGLIGYGLYLYKPWISFSVVGGLLLMLGMIPIMRR